MELTQKSDKEVLEVITPIMNNIGDGAREVDWVKHSRDFSSSLKPRGSQQKFEKMMSGDDRGEHLNRELCGLFRRNNTLVAIWKQFYQKTTQEFVLEAIFIEEDGRVVVESVVVF